MKKLVLLLVSVLVFDARAATLQERIDAAAPNETITLEAGVYDGPIVLNKPLTLVGNRGAEIRGNGKGKTIQIVADGVTVRGLRVTNSGLDLMEDDAGIFVTGNDATIENNEIAESLHGIFLKKVRHARDHRKPHRGQNNHRGVHGADRKGHRPERGKLRHHARFQSPRQRHSPMELRRQPDCRQRDQRSARRHLLLLHEQLAGREQPRFITSRYGLHYMYSNDNVFVNNTFTENAAGGAVMFSHGLTVRNNHFVNNRGLRAYGLIFQSTDNSLLEQNEITQNAVGLSFNQCNGNRIVGNRVTQNYIGLKFGSNSDDNRFTENVFARNLHPVETGGATGSGDKWAVNGVGNRWDGVTEFDLDHDGVNDLPHRELDLFGILRRDFPAVAFLSDSPAVKLLRFAQERAALPGLSSIDDPSPLTSRFWNIRAQRAAQRPTK